MIPQFPVLYPDELVYSWLARYYIRTGYLAYTFVAEELFISKSVRPNPEFLNSYTQEVVEWIEKTTSMNEIVLQHTMFPYYGRFLPKMRKIKAFEALKSMKGNYHNLLPIPQTKDGHIRKLKYCPLCAADDRKQYGETYWHRSHQMIGITVCPVHKCCLLISGVEISGKASPSLITAEEVVPETVEVVTNVDEIEIQLASYMSQVFLYPVQMGEVNIGTVLGDRIASGYAHARNGQRLISKFHKDFMEFAGKIQGNWFTELWQLQKLLTNERINFFEICLLAMYLGMSAEELCTAGIGLRVEKSKRRKSENPLRSGSKPRDWEQIDEFTLPMVREVIRELQGDIDRKPKRVTVFAVEKRLALPSKRISLYLPKCLREIKLHEESQEQVWAKQVVWAVNRLVMQGQPITMKRIRRLTNMRQTYINASIPHLARYADTPTLRQIDEVVKNKE